MLKQNLILAQNHVDVTIKDKRKVQEDYDQLREKLRDTMKEKGEVETNFNLIHQHEIARLTDLESKFDTISNQYLQAKEELA